MAEERLVYEIPFHQIPDELVKDERTNVYHIAVFSALAMHANRERRAWPSYKRLAALCGCSRSKAKATVSELQSMGWITVYQRADEETGMSRTNIYALSPSLQRRAHSDRGVGRVVTEGRAHGDPEPDPENHIHKNHITADAVIDHLNEKADKHYRHTATNRNLVKARLKEGFTTDECKTVIDNQVTAWKHDSKMNEYLRPATLFAPSKFEGYLNRQPSKFVPWDPDAYDEMVREREESRKAGSAAG